MSTADNPPPVKPEQVPASSPPAPETAAGPADPSNGIQGSAGAPPGEPIPLPPLPRREPPSPARFARALFRLDAVLVALVLLFAFLVASFPVYNGDFFLHAATGRLIAQGRYTFGADPFTFTAPGRWVNHSWLYDLIVYAVYQVPVIGGTAVVVVKALLIAALAAVMLRAGRKPGGSLWVPAVCTALALLTLSSRLFLQPVCVSYFFLGLTLWLLERPRQLLAESQDPSAIRNFYRSYWLIPPLFVLWVNLDEWFLLGPATVSLYLLGELLQPLFGRPSERGSRIEDRGSRIEDRGSRIEDRERQSSVLGPRSSVLGLALVLVAGLVACLINPYHVHAFTLPSQLGLSGAGRALAQDPQFRGMFLSPLHRDTRGGWFYFQSNVGLNPAGLAYFVLIGAGLLSFLLGLWAGPWRGWRALVWVGFLALSLYHYRSIPFFAVVAGPVTALNFLDFAARRFGTALRLDEAWRRWSLGGRAVTAFLLLLLAAAAVPGWLEPYQAQRHLGWAVVVDPSLQRLAEKVRHWRDKGLLPEKTHWFNTTTDMVNYFAWFCPDERGFLDQRLSLFGPNVAREYAAVRAALSGQGGNSPDRRGEPGLDWQKVFRDRQINFLVFDAGPYPDTQQLTSLSMLASLIVSSQDSAGGRGHREWTYCGIEGHTAVFAWSDPLGHPSSDPYAPLRRDEKRAAFGPGAEPAPPEWPGREPEPPPWWAVFWRPQPPRSADADTAFLEEDIRYAVLAQYWALQTQRDWLTRLAAEASGLAGMPGGPVLHGLPTLRILAGYLALFRPQAAGPRGVTGDAELFRRFVDRWEAGSPASLYEAIRACRRALAANPEDGRSYLLLARAYHTLALQPQQYYPFPFPSREQEVSGSLFPHTTLIRQVQVAGMANNALKLNLTLQQRATAHGLLYELYQKEWYLDLFEPDPRRRLRVQPFLDLLAQHLRELIGCERALGPLLNQPSKDFEEWMGQRDKQLQRLEEEVRKNLDQYEVKAANRRALQKVQIAMQLGLAKKALDVLQAADGEELKAPDGTLPGGVLLLQLQLLTGRLDQVRNTLGPELQKPLGMLPDPLAIPAYEWFQVQLAAASGDYRHADESLQELQAWAARQQETAALLEQMDLKLPRNPEGQPPGLGPTLALVLGQVLLREASPAANMPPPVQTYVPFQLQPPYALRFPSNWQTTLGLMGQWSSRILQQDTDLWSLRGWLALEAGNNEQAYQHFRRTLALSRLGDPKDRSGPLLRFRSVPLARYYLQWLEPYFDNGPDKEVAAGQ